MSSAFEPEEDIYLLFGGASLDFITTFVQVVGFDFGLRS